MNLKFNLRFPLTAAVSMTAVLSATAIVFASQHAQDAQPAAPQTNPAPAATPPAAPPDQTQGARPVQGAAPTQNGRTARPAPAPVQQPAAAQQPAPVYQGNDPRVWDRSIPNSQVQQYQGDPTNRTWSTPNGDVQPRNSLPPGAGYTNSGGMVNSDALQNQAITHVHYHYHYDGSGGFVGNAQPGYASVQYVNPDDMNQPVNPMNVRRADGTVAGGAGGGGMYNNNPNGRIGGANGGAGIPVTWNPFLGDGSGVMTYGGVGGAVEGFND